ncbi:arylsulfatase J-like [Ruditapes philippinarum]|uniref:arylsulfatase J-like n=1 Tax=Ruditapes philippinarum TaxID=129788 RepID=UPI00295B133D|nr:arylsulfatase J-like [Ruditapes philippinarum]
MHTPNLDNLARQGVILDSSYVQSVCTPSRSSLMTGLYPYHTGMQHGVIRPFEPKFLPEKFEILPQKLKNLGYSTHIIGKWHLGYCNWKYTPTYRGFDSFFGFYAGSESYYNHTKSTSYDFRLNEDVYYQAKGTYSAELFSNRVIDIINEADPDAQPLYLYISFQSVHGPLEVPERFEKYYPDVVYPDRKTYSGMVSALDEAVGNITGALEANGFMDNAVIVFTTDNGGKATEGGSNYPLRGNKGSLWEGGTRGVAFVHSPTLLKKSGYINSEMIHAVDWFPTLVHLAGGKPDPSLDGVNQWKTISKGLKSARDEFIYNIDNIVDKWAIRVGDYKLLYGENPDEIDSTKRLQLFDLKSDPFEEEDIAEKEIDIVESLVKKLNSYRDTLVPANTGVKDVLANPHKFNRDLLRPGWC